MQCSRGLHCPWSGFGRVGKTKARRLHSCSTANFVRMSNMDSQTPSSSICELVIMSKGALIIERKIGQIHSMTDIIIPVLVTPKEDVEGQQFPMNGCTNAPMQYQASWGWTLQSQWRVNFSSLYVKQVGFFSFRHKIPFLCHVLLTCWILADTWFTETFVHDRMTIVFQIWLMLSLMLFLTISNDSTPLQNFSILLNIFAI